jgi:ABC-type glycerol-3-phosphate transport system substrate-binding protein
MVRTFTSRMVLAAALAGVLAACAGEAPTDAPADAAADAPAVATAGPEVLKDREENFEAIGKAFKAVRGELERRTRQISP